VANKSIHTFSTIVFTRSFKSLFLSLGLLIALVASVTATPSAALAHEGVNFEYICSVTQKNKDGLFRDVINVVFMPDWQKASHLFRDETRFISFEITPVLNGMGEVEKYEMVLQLFLDGLTTPSLVFHGPEFSEVGFEAHDLNIGAHCFHRSQRGK
jgi:hypothetical protein